MTCAEAARPSFNSKPWINDYSELRQHLEKSYANLTWFASPQGELDLPKLHRKTLSALNNSKSASEAKAVIESFVEAFYDGHLYILPKASTLPDTNKTLVSPLSRSSSSTLACAQLDFVHKKGTAFSLPFEVSPGFELLNSGESDSFRTGIANLPNGKKIGILRVSVMRQNEFPNECERAWNKVTRNQKSGVCDSTCKEEVNDRAMEFLLEDLSQRLHAFSKLGVSAVLLDIGGNSGGNDLGDWIPRLFTSREIHSPRLGIVTDPKSVVYYDEQLAGISSALKGKNSSTALSALNNAADEFKRLKELALNIKKCDMSWVWRERRAWFPLDSKCTNLSFGQSYFSGALDFLKSGTLGSPEVEKSLYWPTIVSPYIGSWVGPVYVVVDKKTGSAAEATAAIFQNNKAAKIIGSKTAGYGCGFMYKDSEFTLSNSRLRVSIPNCVRLIS
jgi:hypothetical protein